MTDSHLQQLKRVWEALELSRVNCLNRVVAFTLLLLIGSSQASSQPRETWQRRLVRFGDRSSLVSRKTSDPTEEAIRALGRLGPGVAPMLQSLYQGQKDDPDVLAAVLLALYEVGPDHGALHVFEVALGDPNELVVVTAASCLYFLPGTGEPILAHALRTHASELTRFYAACGLQPAASCPNPEVVRTLITALSDPDPLVRAVVLFGLQRAFRISAEGSTSWDTSESLAAKKEIESLADGCTHTLIELFERDSTPSVRSGAVLALRGRSFETTAKGLVDPAPGVRGAAAHSLAGSFSNHPQAPSLVPVVVALLFDASPYARRAAARAVMCLKTEDPSAVASLLHLSYYDSDPEVRQVARRNLQWLLRRKQEAR